ncbi:MAG: hypothetical protein IT584_02140, partial [Chlamydiae bacterium]|nr:hypothetical protein [Chlamydiota bacterium]
MKPYFIKFPNALEVWNHVDDHLKEWCAEGDGFKIVSRLNFVLLSMNKDLNEMAAWCQMHCPMFSSNWSDLKGWEQKWCIQGNSLQERANRYQAAFCWQEVPSTIKEHFGSSLVEKWKALPADLRLWFFKGDVLEQLFFPIDQKFEIGLKFFDLPKHIQKWCLDCSPGEDRIDRFCGALQIAACIEQKSSRIDFVKPLSSLPDLREFRYIRELRLVSPVFSTFTNLETLRGLKKLEIVSFKAEPLKGIPSLPGLRELHLEDGWFRSLDGIENLTGLKILSCKQCKSYVSAPFPSLPRLEELIFTESSMSELPVNVESLESLRALQLTGIQGITPIASLYDPENAQRVSFTLKSLSPLKSLQRFILANTSIEELPDLSELENLDTLAIVESPISDLPGIEELENLEKLTLIHTKMNVLPGGIRWLFGLSVVQLGKEFGSAHRIGSELWLANSDDVESDAYIHPATYKMEISKKAISENPRQIFDQWITCKSRRPLDIRLLDENGDLFPGKGEGVKRQFYADLASSLFQKEHLFNEFYKALPAVFNPRPIGNDLIWLGRLWSYMYRWGLLTGKIVPDTFFGILQALKKQESLLEDFQAQEKEEGKKPEDIEAFFPLSSMEKLERLENMMTQLIQEENFLLIVKEGRLKTYSQVLDLLLKGEENGSLRELKAFLEGNPVSPEFLNAFGEGSDRSSDSKIHEEAVLTLHTFLKPYLPSLEIAGQILKGISGPLERDLVRYPFSEVSSRLQGFVSAEDCIKAFRRNSSDKQVNQKIDWLEELLCLKEKVGDPVFVEDFISYATGGRSLDEGDIITIGESSDECIRVTTCTRILSLSKTVQSKEEFWELMEALVKDREYSTA